MRRNEESTAGFRIIELPLMTYVCNPVILPGSRDCHLPVGLRRTQEKRGLEGLHRLRRPVPGVPGK